MRICDFGRDVQSKVAIVLYVRVPESYQLSTALNIIEQCLLPRYECSALLKQCEILYLLEYKFL